MLILPWMMKIRNQDQYRSWFQELVQLNWQVSFCLWILEVKKGLLKNMCSWHERKLLMQSTSWMSWWIWHGIEKSNWFRFEWRANEGEWCEWATNTNSQASANMWICPITINFAVELSSEFSLVDVLNMKSFMDKLNKILISNVNKHHQWTLYSYFRSVWPPSWQTPQSLNSAPHHLVPA